MSSSYCLVFHFTLQDFFQCFLLGRTSGNEFPQRLFIWEYLYLSLIFEGQFCWIQECITPLPTSLISDEKSYWGSCIDVSLLSRCSLISWRQVLPDMLFLVDSFFLLELWIHHPITFWPTWLHWEFAERLIQTHSYVIIHFSLAAFKSDFLTVWL